MKRGLIEIKETNNEKPWEKDPDLTNLMCTKVSEWRERTLCSV